MLIVNLYIRAKDFNVQSVNIGQPGNGTLQAINICMHRKKITVNKTVNIKLALKVTRCKFLELNRFCLETFKFDVSVSFSPSVRQVGQRDPYHLRLTSAFKRIITMLNSSLETKRTSPLMPLGI